MNIPEVLRALDLEIAQLQQAREILIGVGSTSSGISAAALPRRGRPSTTAKPKARVSGKRIMSDEGKARIAAAQTKRWAKSRKAVKVTTPVAVPKKATAPAKKSPVKKAAVPAGKAVMVKAVAKKAPPTKKPARTVQKATTKKASPKKGSPVPMPTQSSETLTPTMSTEETASE